MLEQKKISNRSGFVGCFMSVLLVVSFFLPRIWVDNPTVNSFNTVLIVVILCLAVHLVRITSALFFEHVWNNLRFSFLWLIPVFNLLVTASQFIWGSMTFMQSPVFLTLLVMFSLPAFCCYYFSVISFFCVKEKRLKISTCILDAAGLLYVLIRLADKVFLPLFEKMGNDIASLIETLFSVSPWFSLVVYCLSFFSFIICAKCLNGAKTVSENK